MQATVRSRFTFVRRAAIRVAFFLPSFLALTLVGGAPGEAQQSSLDLLQQLQRGQSGGLGQSLPAVGGTYVGQQPDMSTQVFTPAPTQGRLPASRLEQILSARAGVRLEQFGYDQLGRGRSVSIAQTGAVQDDYVLGPGDQIVVSLRGQENRDDRLAVDRNGQVMMPRLKPISAIGRSFGSFRQDLQEAVRRAYVATDATVSVATVRQIRVLVSGEVNNPGQRTLSGLSSVVDTILLSGGIKKSGSLRNVRLQRGSRQYVIDLYSVLTDGGAASNLRLADGDRIVVPLLGATAAVSGLVRRPGIYELPSGQGSLSVGALLALAGGQEVRGLYRLSLLQILPDGRTSLTALNGEAGTVRSSEILFVQLGADQTVNQVTLGGSTGLAGVSPIVEGTKLSQWLNEPGALGNSPYSLFGLIVRKDPRTLLRSLLPFTPVAVRAGREDRQLQSEDFIRSFSADEAQLLMFVMQTYLERLGSAQTAIRNPLSQAETTGNTQLQQQLQSQSGQSSAMLDDITSVPADIQRREIISLLDVAAPGSELARRQREARARRAEALQRDRQAPPQAVAMQPNTQGLQYPDSVSDFPRRQLEQQEGSPDDIYPRNIPVQELDRNDPDAGVTSSGFNRRDASRAPGQDDFTSATANFTDPLSAPGRFAANREVETFGQLVRQLGIDPLILINFLVDSRVRLEGAVQGPGYYLAGPNVTVTDLLQAAGGTVNWADDSGVELISTVVDRQGGKSTSQRTALPRAALASYTLRPRDQLRFGRIFTDVGVGSVTVQGEVRNPGNFSIMRGERLSELLARAGGLTNTAYPAGTIFLRRTAAQTEREGYNRAANEVQNQLVVAMTRIGNDRVDPSVFASMQTFIAELRNQRALGRVSVAADPSVLASNPGLDPLLEAGDVVYIPQRPNAVSVLGQVLQPGSYPYQPNLKLGDYIARAGGYASTADASQTFVVMPDGSARRVERSWLSFSATSVLPPGSSIVVPRDLTPLDLRQTIIDISTIFSQFAISIASLAVISRQ